MIMINRAIQRRLIAQSIVNRDVFEEYSILFKRNVITKRVISVQIIDIAAGIFESGFTNNHRVFQRTSDIHTSTGVTAHSADNTADERRNCLKFEFVKEHVKFQIVSLLARIIESDNTHRLVVFVAEMLVIHSHIHENRLAWLVPFCTCQHVAHLLLIDVKLSQINV